jgi:hypothetical protein
MIKGLKDTSLTNIINQMTSSTVSQKKINNLICPDCNKTFKHPNSIYNHRKTCKKNIELCIEIKISNDTKEKKRKYKLEKVNCDVCSKSVSKGNLSTHKKKHQIIAKSNIPVKLLIKPKVASLEETYDFLMWLYGSHQYFINSFKEYQDAFDTYKTISPIIKDDKVIINLNFDDIIQDQELDDEIQDQEIKNEIQEQEINDEPIQEQEIMDEIQDQELNNEIQEQQINDEPIQDQEINNGTQEPSPNDNEPIPDENIIISIAECNKINNFEEDEELENYNDEYSYFEKSKKDDKQIYNLIRANTSQHYFFKINKFLKRYEKSNLINYDIDGLKTCTNSIIKIKKSLQILMKLADDEIYNDNLSRFIKETIDNNFISRTLLAGLKIKYNELEFEDESWNKYEFIKTIYDSLNDMKEQVLKIWDKKLKKLIKR